MAADLPAWQGGGAGVTEQDLIDAINSEAGTRMADDNVEESARSAADSDLDARVSALEAAGGSGSSGIGAAVSPPLLADIDNGHFGLWEPTGLPVGDAFDTLARFKPADEQTILQDGGVACGQRLDYGDPTLTRVAIAAGWYGPSVSAQGTYGVAIYPLCLPNDEFTIECSVNPGAAALSTLSNVTLWKAIASGQAVTLGQHLGTLSADYSMDGHTVTASLAIVAGDVPANTWTRISVIWDASAGTMRIVLGANAKSAVTGSPTPNPAWNLRTWEADPRLGDHGIILGHDRAAGGTPTGIKISDAVVRRYKRTYMQQGFRPKPGVTVNAGSSLGAFPTRLGGVVGHYTGWAQDEASEAAFATVRAAQLDTLQAAGCPLVRIAEFHKRAVPTISAGAITSIDFTGLDAHWDRFASRGLKAHSTLGYVPQAFNGSTNDQLPPTAAATGTANEAAAFALYAGYISQVFGHLKARYPGMIESISFFNEPSLLWAGTLAQFKSLWAAVATRHATDHPDLPAIGGPSEVGVSTYTTGVLDQAVTSGLTPGSALVHYYDPYSLTGLWETVDALNDAATARSLAIPLQGVTEWGMINNATSGYATGRSIVSQETPQRQNGAWMAAYVHASLYEMAAMGVDLAAFFRLGQQASFIASGGGEEMMALLSNSTAPRAWPAFGAFSLFWAHAGDRVDAVSSWPGVRALASKDIAGKISVSLSSLRSYQSQRTQQVQFAWAGLPATYTWEQRRLDHREAETGRAVLVASGDETNPPTAAELAGVGVGSIEITPS